MSTNYHEYDYRRNVTKITIRLRQADANRVRLLELLAAEHMRAANAGWEIWSSVDHELLGAGGDRLSHGGVAALGGRGAPFEGGVIAQVS